MIATSRTWLRASQRLVACGLHVLWGLWIVRSKRFTRTAAQRHVLVQQWAQKMLCLLDVRLNLEGVALRQGSLLVLNHVSWLDILAVHAVVPQARFVSKADVKAWPLLAHLIDSAGTLYIERQRKRDALRVVHDMAQALQNGDTVAIFPEGTTTDGRRLLPFHGNLLQAAIATATPIQPVALRYSDTLDRHSQAVFFVGNTTLLQSLWRVACANGLQVHITVLAPRATSQFTQRQALAALLRSDIEQHAAQMHSAQVRAC